jgi:hypothetical protein
MESKRPQKSILLQGKAAFHLVQHFQTTMVDTKQINYLQGKFQNSYFSLQHYQMLTGWNLNVTKALFVELPLQMHVALQSQQPELHQHVSIPILKLFQ